MTKITRGNPLPEYARLTNQSERYFTAQILEYAQLLGWRTAHFRPGQTSRTYFDKNGNEKKVWVTPVQGQGKGFPDIIMVKGKRLICAELKSEKGKLTEEQDEWLISLAQTDAEVYTWHPSDWSEIEEILR